MIDRRATWTAAAIVGAWFAGAGAHGCHEPVQAATATGAAKARAKCKARTFVLPRKMDLAGAPPASKDYQLGYVAGYVAGYRDGHADARAGKGDGTVEFRNPR